MSPSPTDLLWSSLHLLTKERLEAIQHAYGSLEEATKHLDEQLLQELGCRAETIQNSLPRAREFNAERYARALDEKDIRFLTLAEEDYPARLKQIADPPPFLYAKGDLSILDQPCIGMVGTREMSSYGRRVVLHFVPRFVAAGVVTVSGLARGIDATVAEETLAGGGKTVAVLGHGLGMIYPEENRRLADEIVGKGGLLLSEFPLTWNPDKYTFVARNRIIAGLSLGTVVLEAPEGSGALLTAEFALEDGRDVFAVPGQVFDPNYVGCHALIARGHAQLATDPASVLRTIGVIASEQSSAVTFIPDSPDEKILYALLTTMPQDIDTLVEKSGLEAGRINAALTLMELADGVKNIGNGMWVRR